MTHASTYDLLRRAADRDPHHVAMIFLPQVAAPPLRVTYGEFMAQLHQMANALWRLGIGPRSVVSLLAPTIPASIVALWASETAGIAHPINFLLKADDIAAMMRATGSELLIALGPHPGTEIWQKALAVSKQVPRLKTVLSIDAAAGDDTARLEDLMRAEPADHLLSKRKILPEDVAAYFHTGGSTGMPKIAMHTHANQIFSATTLARYWSFGPETRMVNGLPLFHVAGSLVIGLAPLCAGAQLLLPTAAGLRNSQVVADHWKLVAAYRPTVIGGIPTSLVALLDVPLAGADISSVQYCVTGGAALPVRVGQEFQAAFGVPIREIYGMTECAGLIAATAPDERGQSSTTPHLIGGIEVQARALLPDGCIGERLPAGQTGMLVTRGPQVFPGYLDEEQNRSAFSDDGWLITGDLGCVDAAGRVCLTGRAKDVIIRSGHNIDPVVIEEAANSHPAVAMSAAVGLPDSYAGEVPILYVTLKPHADHSPQQLDAHLRRTVAEAPARPREIVVLDAMPLTAVGKIFKPALRRDAVQRAAHAAVAPHVGTQAALQIDVAESSSGRLAAKITLGHCPPAQCEALCSAVREALSRFNFDHEVVCLPAGAQLTAPAKMP